MLQHIRFLQAFASYEKGKSYRLPYELSNVYLKAGVAEVVDCVAIPEPKPPAPHQVVAPAEKAEAVVKPVRKKTNDTDDDSDTGSD